MSVSCFASAGGSGEADLQIRFVPGYALDPDAIKSYIKIGQLQETKKKWPAGMRSCVWPAVIFYAPIHACHMLAASFLRKRKLAVHAP